MPTHREMCIAEIVGLWYNNSMKLSFVIPAYNEELYIGKCLDSVVRELKNTPYDVEVIVVNNAGTDRTREIASRYDGFKIVDQPIKGLVHARQAGFAASTGDIIANVDSDAMLTPGWIDKVMKEFSANPNLVGLSGPFIYYDSPRSIRFGTRFFYYVGFAGYLLARFVFRVGSMLQGGNFIIRRAALEKIGGFDTSISFYGEDTDIARRLHPLGDVKWTFSLPMYASGRRLMNEGAFTMGLRYAINYFWTTVFGKPFSERYTDIRVAQIGDTPLTYRPQNKRREFAIALTAILLLLIILGGVGFFIGYQVNAKDLPTGRQESPKEFALRMYRQLSDGDNDFGQVRLQLKQFTHRLYINH